jgi:hypothetical protein
MLYLDVFTLVFLGPPGIVIVHVYAGWGRRAARLSRFEITLLLDFCSFTQVIAALAMAVIATGRTITLIRSTARATVISLRISGEIWAGHPC